mgnify:CR=1 FL=1
MSRKNINFVNYPWTRDLNELKKGKVDVMFNALRTEERKQYAFYKKYQCYRDRFLILNAKFKPTDWLPKAKRYFIFI